ncbi:MAG: aminotransferase class I/II-fold pyridoxal phosphate-dependent enzyme [Nitrososphaerota archaeon]|nr:aminotransferase class I/II-fold pyridoxal phosphate-dependent enzyme [Nitrososphaerota archaeon]
MKEIGALKEADSLPMEDDRVEDELVKQVLEGCDRVGLDREAGLKILNVLVTESKRVQGIRGRTSPVPIFSKALELQRKRVKLIRLDVGEPDFAPPQAVLEACSEALFAHKTHYTESQGIPELTEALVGYLARKHGFKASEGEVAVTPSGRFAVYAALASVVGELESVIVPEPNWPAYRDSLQQLGAKAVAVHTSIEEGWTPSIKGIERAIRPNTKAIILSYPNNPTGRVISKDLFRQIVELSDDRGLTVISDEIYNEYTPKPSPSVLETTPKKFILTSSFSKTWAMTGFRIGYSVSSKETTSKIARMISLMFTSVPEFIQWGAIRALDADGDVRRNVAEMSRRIDVACKELDGIDGLEYVRPDGGMYVFPELSKGRGSGESFAQRLLDAGVSVTPGILFGDYGDFFRISLGQQEHAIVEGIRRMGRFLS